MVRNPPGRDKCYTANSTSRRYTKIMKGGTGIPVIHIGLVVSNSQVFPIDVEILFELFPFQSRAINNFNFKQKVEPQTSQVLIIWKVDRKNTIVPYVVVYVRGNSHNSHSAKWSPRALW